MCKIGQCPAQVRARSITISGQRVNIITARKRSFAKVMFSQVSVCPPGGVYPLHAGIHTPPGQTPPLGRHPPGRHIPSWADTPDCDCSCYCLNQASLTMRTRGRAGKFPVGRKPIGLKQLLIW